MSLIRAQKYLEKYNKEKDIILLDKSTATVEEAAGALGVENNEIAKSLSFDLGSKYILVIVAGDYKIDNHKFKETFGVKASMISRERVEEIIGHDVGGVCPFGINENINVFLDVTLNDYEYVYPACGTDNSAIKLTPKELFMISKAKEYVDVCKEITNER